MNLYIGYYIPRHKLEENEKFKNNVLKRLGSQQQDGSYILNTDTENIIYRIVPLYIPSTNRIIIANVLNEETIQSTIKDGQAYIVYELIANNNGNYHAYAALKIPGIVIPEEVNLNNVPNY